MKKHLIAAAVAAAVAVPAMAQNVSIDGYLEAGYSSIKKGSQTISGINGATDVFGGSEINFRGSEDLGGGLSASFRITAEFNEGNGSTASTSAAGNEWTNIQVNLGSKDLGTLSAGRFVSGARDLGGIYRFNGDFGRVAGYTQAIGNRAPSQFQYQSPSVNGFSLVVSSGSQETDTTVTGWKENLVMLRYENGPLRAAVSSGKRSNDTATNQKEQAIGASYNLGFMRLGLAHFKDDLDAADGTTFSTADSSATVLQFDVPLSGGINVFGSYIDYNSKANNADSTGVSLGVSKALSKRTKVFAVYNKNDNDANANLSFRADSGASVTNGQDVTRAGVGVTHSF